MSDTPIPQLADDKESDDHRDLDELGEKLRQVQKDRETKLGTNRPSEALPQSGLGIGLRIGMELLVGVLIGLGIGWQIDRWAGTEPWGLLVFFILGFAAGILNVVRAANKMNDSQGGMNDSSKPPKDE